MLRGFRLKLDGRLLLIVCSYVAWIFGYPRVMAVTLFASERDYYLSKSLSLDETSVLVILDNSYLHQNH